MIQPVRLSAHFWSGARSKYQIGVAATKTPAGIASNQRNCGCCGRCCCRRCFIAVSPLWSICRCKSNLLRSRKSFVLLTREDGEADGLFTVGFVALLGAFPPYLTWAALTRRPLFCRAA